MAVEKPEKKVEYLELVYDLVFVYIIGRNNSLLHNIKNGFLTAPVFLAYALCSLAIIQIWNFSTFYTNLYGRNSIREHISLFLNMYLLYYIGEGTRLHWESFQNQYHLAWALILINIGVQYALELRNHANPGERQTIRGMMIALFGEAVIVLAAIPIYNRTGMQIAGVAILYGVAATLTLSGGRRVGRVDFPHLSERAMLYVVYAKPGEQRRDKFVLRSVVLSLAFVVGMIALRENMRLNILVTVAYVAAQMWMLYQFSRSK